MRNLYKNIYRYLWIQLHVQRENRKMEEMLKMIEQYTVHA